MIIGICSHGSLASVASPRTQVLGASGHAFRVVNLLHLDRSEYSLFFKNVLLFDDLFVILELIYFYNNFVDLSKDLHIVFDSTTMFLRKDMLNIIFKLLATNGANNMICSWFWLFNTRWVFIFLGLLFLHGLNIVIVLLVKELGILFCKLSFFLQLEDTSSEWCFQIEGWDVVFTNVYLLA